MRRVAVTKLQIQECRQRLGSGCSVPDVAEALGVAIPTVRRRLSAPELHEWATAYRQNRKDGYLDRAIRKLKIKALALNKFPTAREAGIHTTVLTKCGGYNAIARAAGFTPRGRKKVA